jgi:thioredoxin reductase (NADPH)
MEAQACDGEEVVVVGGGNSAGQAAVFLAQHTKGVHLLVRSEALCKSMSQYLIERIETNPRICVHFLAELTSMEGEEHLEVVRWRDKVSGIVTCRPIRHVFVMAGASPCTHWLSRCVSLDRSGFIVTGQDLLAATAPIPWPLSRDPLMLETSLPGVFAVGDARSGSVKKVASAVGEGSIVVSLIHQVLRAA